MATPVTATALVIVQAKLDEPAAPVPSVAVMVTVETPGVVGVPMTRPVEVLNDRPAGRLVADQVRLWPDEVS